MGRGSVLWWTDLVPAIRLTIMPFGLTAQEYDAWVAHGGGQELLDRVYGEVGCKYLSAGNTGMQMGGWFPREIRTVDDFKGLKIRISGFAADVLRSFGAEPDEAAPWSAEARQGLEEGEYDAYEHGGPAADLNRGLHERFKYYYYPAWHEPSVPFDIFINRAAWDGLAPHLRTTIEAAALRLNYRSILSSTQRNAMSLETLAKQHRVQPRPFPDRVLQELAARSDRVIREWAAHDALSMAVLESLVKFRSSVSRWGSVTLGPFIEARLAAHQD